MSYMKTSKTRKSSFSVPKGVTLENSFHYITAVEEAAEKGIKDIPVEERRLVLASVLSALQMAEHALIGLMHEAEVEEKKLS